MAAFHLQEFNGHKFSTTQFSIPTFCEHCTGFIWGLDKGFVCQGNYQELNRCWTWLSLREVSCTLLKFILGVFPLLSWSDMLFERLCGWLRHCGIMVIALNHGWSFRQTWTKNGSSGPKSFRVFRETGPWRLKWVDFIPLITERWLSLCVRTRTSVHLRLQTN